MKYYIASKHNNSYYHFNIKDIEPELANVLNFISQFTSNEELKKYFYDHKIISDTNIELVIIMLKKLNNEIKYYEIVNENYFPLKNSPFIYSEEKLVNILKNNRKNYSFISFLFTYVIKKRGYTLKIKEKLEKMSIEDFYKLFLNILNNNKRTVLNSPEINLFSDKDLINFKHGEYKELENIKSDLISYMLNYNDDLIYIFSKFYMNEINYHKTLNYFYSLLRLLDSKKYDERVFNSKFNYIIDSIFKNENAEYSFRCIFDFLKYYYVANYGEYISYLHEDYDNGYDYEDEIEEIGTHTY